jgi:dynein heavy chain, axonemal
VEEMGRTYIEPPPFDLEKSYNDSHCCSPLIFILSAGSDPMSGLVKFSMEKKVVSFETISLGQGQVTYEKKYKTKPLPAGCPN